MKRFQVSIVLDVMSPKLTGPEIARKLENYFRAWSDGRYPLEVEMIAHAVNLILGEPAASTEMHAGPVEAIEIP
jgi:hypothetical protein